MDASTLSIEGETTVHVHVPRSRPIPIKMYQVTPQISLFMCFFSVNYCILCPSYVSAYGNLE